MKRLAIPLGFYTLILAIYAVWSFGLTAPNLVLSGWPPYWNFQTWMWETFFNNRVLLAQSFVGIMALAWLSIGLILKKLWTDNNKFDLKEFVVVVILVASPLLLATQALSYDIYNYLFNAKMVMVYQADPHQRTAIEFDDDWTRFMHNVHTPAPYGYGWTALSLLPFIAGAGKLLPILGIYKVLNLLSLIGSAWVIKFLADKLKIKLSWFAMAVVFLNPLVLIEVVGNLHNDLYMLFPAVLSLGLILKDRHRFWLLSIALLLISISIKLATVVLVPIWLWLVFWPKLVEYLPLISSIALFAPLLTARSKMFLPWYLIWVLIWWPLIWRSKQKWFGKVWAIFVVLLSVTASLRYLPYLYYGEHSVYSENLQLWIVWLLPVMASVLSGFFLYNRKQA